ncbi:hypothetical protein PPTG_21631 [Phytophthora nicotianae INRA-310]|uniref:DDE Tnp4 domain-containing protein n=1 Tax=Phytophthora nicotianae (strain INRA-310) TaxID=761204 RepID=W2QY92_PHYN3|nr:hypothetical protein PPTG_21631 [Phytophthora nicotianae INRA-310]ETN17230.1 hypothetical protein PPTG_21631 [Phytophthora nicotianae INRA-310]
MPTRSRRYWILAALRRVWANKLTLIADDGDSSEEEEEQELMMLYFVLNSKRYLSRRERFERPECRVEYYLTGMSNENFRLNFRMNRQYFTAVCQLITNHDVFCSVPGKQPRMRVEIHLMALLKMLGSLDGYGLSADFLSVGSHTPESLLTRRAMEALLSYKNAVICWPDAVERREISARIENVSGFPCCVGLIDGTLFPLRTRPQKHGEDYYSRKASYAINGLVVSDDKCRIRYENVGWPGSSHDNRVWRNCKLARNREQHFNMNEYLLGDSAYQPSNVMVSSYKTIRGGQLSTKEEGFNSQLAKIRIRVEHCIGMLKGRFPLLKALRCRLRNKKEKQDTIQLIQSAMILHNMAIGDPMPDDWVVRESDDDEWADELPRSSRNSDQRRAYLRDYIFDLKN